MAPCDDRAAFLGQLERSCVERRCQVVFLARRVHTGQIDRGAGFEILPSRLLRKRELVAGIAFRIRQAPAPPGTRVEDVERIEARLIVVAVRHVEGERG